MYPMLPFSLDCTFFFAPSVLSNIYLSCVLCTLCSHFLWIINFWLPLRCCQFLWIVPFSLPLRCSLTFTCPVSCVLYVASFSGLSLFLCPFGILERLFIIKRCVNEGLLFDAKWVFFNYVRTLFQQIFLWFNSNNSNRIGGNIMNLS